MSQPGPTAPIVWTVGRLLAWTTEHFKKHGVDEPRLAAEILLAHAMGCPRIALYTRFEEQPVPAQLDIFREHVKKAAQHAPIAYLVGTKEFFSLSFKVTPAVLIPRPETELLCEQVIDAYRSEVAAELKFLDLGTGSGCIAVTLLKYLPQAQVVATDVSAKALEVAKENAAKHNVAERATFLLADRLGPDVEEAGPFDALVSNPPYIGAEEMGSLPRDVREYEPAGALTDGADGLSFYRMFAERGGSMLKPGGSVFVEVADGQAEAVRALFAQAGGWEHVATWKDNVGPHERVIRHRRRLAAADQRSKIDDQRSADSTG